MIPHHSSRLAHALRREDLQRAETIRWRRAARIALPGTSGAVDALGHRLIAIGIRLVRDPAAHPTHTRAA